jgi:hypothetical protein
MKVLFNYFYITILLIIIILSGCSTNNKSLSPDNDTLSDINENHGNRVKTIFYNLPSPIEMTTIIGKSGAIYKPDILNPFSNVENYITSTKLALNFGTYCTDMSYVRIYDQIQLSMSYLSSIKKVYQKLNVPEEIGKTAFIRMENNMNNKDSMLQIISETTTNIDSYLKDNEQSNTSTLIISGGWIEALFISTQIVDYDNPKNHDIINRIAEQKYSFENLLILLQSYPNDNDLKELYKMIFVLKPFFDNIKIDIEKGEIVTDESKKHTYLKSKTIINFKKSDFNEIKRIISEVRKKVVEN